MKKQFSHLFLASCFILAFPFFSQAQFQYLSPEPGSKYHNPNTTIILRNGNQLDEASLQTKHLFKVQGSLSGKHDFEVKLAENGKTIILKPTQPFSGGETVTVNIAEGMRSSSQERIHGTSFSFEITKTRTPEESQRIGKQMQQLWQEEFGPGMGTTSQKKKHPGFPKFSIDTNTTTTPGYVFWSNFNLTIGSSNDHYCIINSAGDSIFGKYDTTIYNDFDLNKNGSLTVYHDEDSTFLELDSNYTPIGAYQMGNGYKSDPHEFILYTNKYHYMLAYDPQIVDMTVYDPTYQPNATVIGSVFQELDSANNVIFQWRSWDHYSILDGDHVIFSGGVVDYCHANSIFVDTDGNILFSCRNMSEITKINRTTGDIIWRWGGKNNQFTLIGDTIKFAYQHDAQRIANGNITLFDNGLNPRARSYAREYTLDEVNKTATYVWSYSRTFNAGYVFARAMGNTQRLSNGNTLICWGLNASQVGAPKISEVDSASNLVWELSLIEADAVYRAHRYVWQPCSRPSDASLFVDMITPSSGRIHWAAATNASSYDLWYRKVGNATWKIKTLPKLLKKVTNLTPSTLYEYEVRSHCTNVPTTVSGFTAIKTFMTAPLKETLTGAEAATFTLYPNPVSNQLQITVYLDEAQGVSVSFYDMMGKEVFHSDQNVDTGGQLLQYDVSGLPAGMYVAEVITAEGKMVQKFMKE